MLYDKDIAVLYDSYSMASSFDPPTQNCCYILLQFGYTPLIVAAVNGHLHVVEILLAHNADTEIMTSSVGFSFMSL